MRRSIATVSLSGTLQEKLEAIAAARFDAVEIFENDLLFFDGPPRAVRLAAADLGLEICLFQPFRDFEAVGDDEFARNLERAERKFDLMEELGAPMMLVCSNVSAAAIDDDARAAAQLAELAERAARRGLRIGYEALAWGRHVNTWRRALDLVEAADHPHLGLVLDSFHTLSLGDDTAAIAGVPGERLFFVQVADAPKMSLDVLSWSRHFRCFPGQGDLDVAGFLAPILAAGYTGPVSLEVFNDDFRAAPSRRTATDGMRSLLYLEEETRARLAGDAPSAPAAARARRRVELFDPPPPAEIGGLAFLEFAVTSLDDEPLEAFLSTLGFARVGRHRSKDVALMRQGDIHVVLNAERDSFAHAYYLVHGRSLCAIGIAVDDAAQALARAEAYHATRFGGRVGASEMPIPAIRAVDGGLIYFVGPDHGRGAWHERDFIAEPTPPPAGDAGLVRIDHLAQALPDGQLDTWILFYRAVLGLKPATVLVLPDPYGLVRSRAVESPNGTLRIPLNISESRNTATAQSVSSYAGAGVHHVAFAAGDILATVRRLKARGVALLSIPRNYYDDLATRFDLDPGFVATLADNDILYDRTAEGEFLQAYTASFDDRFFFEVVERRGGYAAYGAANAPVRMAAQALFRRRDRGGDADIL